MKMRASKTNMSGCAAGLPVEILFPLLGRFIRELAGLCGRRWGLLPSSCIALVHIYQHPDASGPAAIASMTCLSPQIVTVILDQLEKHGMAVRMPYPGDRRRKAVQLSDKGRQLARAILRDFSRVEKIAIGAMDVAHLENTCCLLARYAEAISGQNNRRPSVAV